MMHSGMNGGGGGHGGDKSASAAVEDGSPTKIPTTGGKAASLVVGQHSPRAHASPQPSPSSSLGQQQATPNHSTRKETEIETELKSAAQNNGPTSTVICDDGGEEHDSRTDSAFGERTEQRMSSAGDVDEYNADGEGEDNLSNPSNDPGKMFIGGLSWQTTAEGLRDYFSKFGEVNECMVMRDPATKRARGFGFITFVDPTSVDKVLEDENHELDGKKIDPKIAFPKRPQPKMVVKTKKVFIGGLSSNSTLDDMKLYFQQFGKIEDAMLMYDKATQRHRGFGFITFDDDEVSDRVCEIHFHEINGKMVECKKAQPKEVMLPVQMNKNRAAAARNLYGLAPEQLLAFANFMPRMPTGSPYPGAAGIPFYPGMTFNGISAHPQSFCLSPSGRSSVSNTNNGGATLSSAGSSSLLRCPVFDLNAVQQMAAQQQAMLEASSYAAYASAMAEQFSPQFHPTTSAAGPVHQHHHLQQQAHHPQPLHNPVAVHPHHQQQVQHSHHQPTHPLTPTSATHHNLLQHPQAQQPQMMHHQVAQHHHTAQAAALQQASSVFGSGGGAGNKI